MRSIGRRKTDRYRIAAGMILGAVLTTYAFYVSSCGGSSTTGPSQTIDAPQPVAAAPAAPAATPTPAPAAGPSTEYDCYVNNSGFHVKNLTSDTQRWQVYTTGFDEQHFATSVIPASGVQRTVGPNTVWEDNPGFKCAQVDVTQELTFVGQAGGRPQCYGYFDKNGVTFHPGTSPEKIAECRQCDPKTSHWTTIEEPTIGEWEIDPQPDSVEQICYKYERRLVIYYEQNDCSKEKRELRRTYEKRKTQIPCPCVEPSPTPEIPGAYSWGEAILQGKCEVEKLPVIVPSAAAVQELNCHRIGTQKFTIDNKCSPDGEKVVALCQNVACPCLFPIPSYQLSLITFPPITGFEYYQMNQGNDNARENACVNRGGTWLNTYDIPGDGEGSRSNVCRFNLPLPPGAPGADVTFLFRAITSGGNPISGSALVSGAGTWKLVLHATNPGDYQKDVATATLSCNDQPKTLTVSYNWVGHPSEDWRLELYLDGVLKTTSIIVHNPTN